MNRLGSAAALAGLLGVSLVQGQQPPPPAPAAAQQATQPVFRAGTNVVRVDVVVMDGHGSPVTNLVAAEFEVKEDNLLQIIQSCQLVSVSGEAAREGHESLEIRSREHAEAEAAREDVRLFLIFWDEYHIERMPSANKAREFLTRFVSTAFGPTDLVALMDPLTPIDAIGFTRKRDTLVRAIQKLQGRRGIFFPPRSVVEEAHLQFMSNVVRLRSEVTISALQAAAAYLGTLRESRKAIVFVSEGLDGLGRDATYYLQDLAQAANGANTAIYTVDPRGLTGAMPSGLLAEIASNTGGEAFLNVNYPERLLRRVVTAQSAYYLLGYQSSQNPADGKFHEIDVRVKRRGVTVRARKGYWAPGATEIERERTAVAAAEAPPDVMDALSVLSSSRDRVATVWVGTTRGADGRTDVTLTWTPHRAAGPSRGPAAAWSVTARAADGRTVFEGSTEGRRVTFSAPPGMLTLKSEIRDAGGAVIDGETRQLSVPDYASPRLAISTPIVLRTQSPVEFRDLGTSSDPAPFAGREFVRTDRLLIRFAIYEAGDRAVEPAVRLLSRRGRVLTALSAAPLAGDPGVHQIDLPLSFAAPGDYVVSIAVQRGDERVESLVALRIVS